MGLGRNVTMYTTLNLQANRCSAAPAYLIIFDDDFIQCNKLLHESVKGDQNEVFSLPSFCLFVCSAFT